MKPPAALPPHVKTQMHETCSNETASHIAAFGQGLACDWCQQLLCVRLPIQTMQVQRDTLLGQPAPRS